LPELTILPPSTGPTGFGIYKLPLFPQEISNRLKAADPAIVCDGTARRRILQILYDDLRSRVEL
jgi:hypothetical protein